MKQKPKQNFFKKLNEEKERLKTQKEKNLKELNELAQKIEDREKDITNLTKQLELETMTLSQLSDQISAISPEFQPLENLTREYQNVNERRTQKDQITFNQNEKIKSLCSQHLDTFSNFIPGQALDSIKKDPNLNVIVKQAKFEVEAVMVKYKIEGTKEYKQMCFRVYQETTFGNLKEAACRFWGIISEDNHQLTDEYSTNLSTVTCTIQDFYKQGYEPINKEFIAIVSLHKKNKQNIDDEDHKKNKENIDEEAIQLQYESIVILDKNNDKQGFNEDNWLLKKKFKINMDDIKKYLPGIHFYKTPEEKEVNNFIKDLNPIRVENNIIIMILYLYCMIASLVTCFYIGQDEMIYRVSKQCEMMIFLQPSPNGTPLSNVTIPETRNQLYQFLVQDFPFRLLTTAQTGNGNQQINTYLDQFDLISLSVSSQHRVLVQVDGPSIGNLNLVYPPVIQISTSYISKRDISDKDWGKFNQDFGQGRQNFLSEYYNQGYKIQFKRNTTQQEFQSKIKEAQSVFFGVGARGLQIEYTVYHKSLDFLIDCKLLFEYGMEDSIILSQKALNPYRPNIYETNLERQFMWLDISRLVISVLITAFCLTVQCYRIYLQKSATLVQIGTCIVELAYLILFLTQSFCMIGQQQTATIFKDSESNLENYQSIYQRNRYIQTFVILVYILIMMRFARFSQYMSKIWYGMNEIMPIVITFTVLWWIYLCLFANAIQYTWGYINNSNKTFDISIIMTICTMVMSSTTNNGIEVTGFESDELFQFFIIVLLQQYLLKMCIVCHTASVILEQFHRVRVLKQETDREHYKNKQKGKSILRDWICSTFSLRPETIKRKSNKSLTKQKL